MALFAVVVTLAANLVMISHAAQGSADRSGDYIEVPDSAPTRRLNMKSCLQGCAMVPITLISIICLALYKADVDAAHIRKGDRLVATKLGATLFLSFVGCEGLLRERSHLRQSEVEATIYLLHCKFIGGTLFASFTYLVSLGIRAVLTEIGPGSERRMARVVRSIARAVFALAVGLLIFAVVGFSPVLLSGLACGVSLLGSCAMLLSMGGHEQPAASAQGFEICNSNTRAQVQAHAFSVITLSCFYCFGCVVLEEVASRPGQDEEEVKLHFVGFQLAFAAAAWFLLTLALRAALCRGGRR
mmetsp:Transcript_11094/g.22485  ORF Transcript_11094/g.22485 Transcript_11094/m.22485 type:complete len:300 (-) Transcript_11094:28-927(-)